MTMPWHALGLAAARLVPLALVAPLGPPSARLVVGGLLAVAVAPSLVSSAGGAALTLPIVASEVGIGLTFGVLVAAFVAAAETAGKLVDAMRRPDTAYFHRHPAWSRALRLLALAAFFVVGGHLVLLDALGRSYAALPPGRSLPGLPPGGVTAAIEAMGGLVLAAAELATPILAVMLVVEVALALVERVAPGLVPPSTPPASGLGGAARELGATVAVALTLTAGAGLLAAHATGLGGALLDAARSLAR